MCSINKKEKVQGEKFVKKKCVHLPLGQHNLIYDITNALGSPTPIIVYDLEVRNQFSLMPFLMC